MSLPMPEPATEYTVTNPLCDNVLGICLRSQIHSVTMCWVFALSGSKLFYLFTPPTPPILHFYLSPPSLPTTPPPCFCLMLLQTCLIWICACVSVPFCTMLLICLSFFLEILTILTVTLFRLLEIFSICFVCSWEGCGSWNILPVTASFWGEIFLLLFFFFFGEGEGVCYFLFLFFNMGSIHVL